MITTTIFDLDGTLLQTEHLKAISYARAAIELCPYHLLETDVIEAFKDVVGLSRREVAEALVKRFDLEEKASKRSTEFNVREPWQAFVEVRLIIYENMLADPEVILNNQWPHNMALLHAARENCRFVALATMSHKPQVNRALKILDLQNTFDFVATRDDVENGKPDPEIYLLVANRLGVPVEACLVLEDSPTGVKAGLNAGMHVIAVSTPFTKTRLHQANLLPADRIIDNPGDLPAAVAEVVKQSKT